jgi:hypothetical protein
MDFEPRRETFQIYLVTTIVGLFEYRRRLFLMP